jgi:hypothetical protein
MDMNTELLLIRVVICTLTFSFLRIMYNIRVGNNDEKTTDRWLSVFVGTIFGAMFVYGLMQS